MEQLFAAVPLSMYPTSRCTTLGGELTSGTRFLSPTPSSHILLSPTRIHKYIHTDTTPHHPHKHTHTHKHAHSQRHTHRRRLKIRTCICMHIPTHTHKKKNTLWIYLQCEA